MAQQKPRDNAMYNLAETMNLKKNDKQILARSDKSHLFGSRLLSANEQARKKQLL